MHTRALLAAATLCALPAQDLSFHAAPETVLTREFRETTRWELVEMIESTGGRGGGDQLPRIEAELTRVFAVRDELQAVDGGRATRIARTILEGASAARHQFAVDGLEEEYEVEMVSPLVDAELQLEWDDEDQAYAVKLESGGDTALLDRLLHDLDLLVVMPDGEVAEGDAWEVEGEGLAALLAPGGALSLELVELPEGGMGMGTLEILCGSLCSAAECVGDVDGELRVVWTETVEEEGEKLAILELELEASFSRELGERVADLLEAGGGEVPEAFRLFSDWTVEGGGRCLWSLDAGHARSLRLELDTSIQATLELVMFGTEVDSEYGLSGTTELDFAFEAE